MNILPLLIIFFSLAGIGHIVFKKLSLIANLDLERIPKEKEAYQKRIFLEKKLIRKFCQIIESLKNIFRAIKDFFKHR